MLLAWYPSWIRELVFFQNLWIWCQKTNSGYYAMVFSIQNFYTVCRSSHMCRIYLIWIRKAVDSQPLQGKIIGNYKSFKIRSWDSKQVCRLEPPLYSSQRQPSIYLYSSSRLTPHLWLLSDSWPLNSPDTWRTNFSWDSIRAMQHFQWGKKTHLEFNQISHLPEVVFSVEVLTLANWYLKVPWN